MPDDFTFHRRGDFHRRFVGHDRSQHLIFGYIGTDLSKPFNEFCFRNPLTHVRHLDDMFAHQEFSITCFSAAPTRAGPGKYSHSWA